MTPNELLLWLSARKEGSWRQFKGAVATLDLASADEAGEDASFPLPLRVHFNLERLGHLEFDAAECEKGWRVVPPALALSQHDGHVTGVLCGARTPKLLERIEQAANGLPLERSSYADCPDVLRLQAPDAETQIVLAGRAGILCQIDAPEALLSRLPPITSLNSFRREALPAFGGREWEVQQFVIDRKVMKWRTITLQEANASDAQGLFRFTHFQMPRYFLREGRETIALPGAIGKYYILFRRQRHVLKYDRKERSLALPVIFRPPLLTERALILCSGFPASISVARGRPILTYRDIPEEVAGITAELLRQALL